MTRKIEPLTTDRAAAILADNQRSHRPASRLIIPVILSDATCGAMPHVEVQALVRGIDWDRDCMIATPTKPLTVLTAEEVRDIQLSMRKGGNWHSFQRYKKQQDKIDALTVQLEALSTEMEKLLCRQSKDTEVKTSEDARLAVQKIISSAVIPLSNRSLFDPTKE
ncbi:particle associated protein [Yersinia phage fHe-Yen8-01]|nr:particle associated protein [Yersinia phage fHe-Yen8-01]